MLKRCCSALMQVYDIRKKCDFAPLCYDFSYLDRFLNQPAVKKELGVEDRYWVACRCAFRFVSSSKRRSCYIISGARWSIRRRL